LLSRLAAEEHGLAECWLLTGVVLCVLCCSVLSCAVLYCCVLCCAAVDFFVLQRGDRGFDGLFSFERNVAKDVIFLGPGQEMWVISRCAHVIQTPQPKHDLLCTADDQLYCYWWAEKHCECIGRLFKPV
jgi:hypothetical protein